MESLYFSLSVRKRVGGVNRGVKSESSPRRITDSWTILTVKGVLRIPVAFFAFLDPWNSLLKGIVYLVSQKFQAVASWVHLWMRTRELKIPEINFLRGKARNLQLARSPKREKGD